MSCQPAESAHETLDAPGQYRLADTVGDQPRQWVHNVTGLAVDLRRYARHKTARDTQIDHYEYRLVIRPDGFGTPGTCVESTRRGFDFGSGRDPVELAYDWMREHADGTADLEVA